MPYECNKASVVFILIVSFILISSSPMIQGYTMNMTDYDTLDEHLDDEYDIYVFNTYDASDVLKHETYEGGYPATSNPFSDVTTIDNRPTGTCDGLMDSPWPMYCHDTRHTGRSPYITVNTTGIERWSYKTQGWATGGPTVDDNGTIYIGSYYLYAIYPDGTLKWKSSIAHNIEGAPAIDENGNIYVGSNYGDGKLYAYNPNGTVKWIYSTGGDIFSSPAIGDDGTIYVGSGSHTIHAIYPNGTRKWKFDTNHVVYSSPAIGADGTIYCSCHDTYLYALYPNNGTLKWKYKTGYWIRTSPCIADDGTIYVVSLDEYLHAVYPNGTMRWKTFVGAGTSPTIGWDGTVYCGGYDLYAINPEDGSVKWIYDAPGTIEGGTPCSSIDGTIYLGTSTGGSIIAVNPDGAEKWRKPIGQYVDSPPAIGIDGTVYIGSSGAPGEGWLYAFGPLDPDAPIAPTIQGLPQGKIKTEYSYNFSSTDLLGKDVWYYISWGDGSVEDWIGPYPSGETVTVSHSWEDKGTYVIEARAKNTDNLWGPWGTLSVTMPTTSTYRPFLQFCERFLECFPNAFPILRHFLDK